MNTFTKTHTQISKGLAILMMLYHHLFVLPERINSDYFSLIDCIMPNAQMTIATFCKLCVCIYVFLSGYGLYCSLKKHNSILKMYKNIIIRASKFLLTFGIIYLLFVPIGMYFGVFNVGFKHFILGLFILESDFFNNTWWFVNAYIVLLIVSPLFVFFLNEKRWIKKIAVISIYPIVWLLGKIFVLLFGTNLIISCYLRYLDYYALILSLFVGMLCAKFKVYERIMRVFERIPNIKHRKLIRICSMCLVLILAIWFRIITVRSITDMRFDFIIAPLFVFTTSTIIYDLKCYSFILLCGSHSTNMWLSHAFLCYTYAQKIVFSPYYSELIFLWFIILSLLISYLINLILVPISNFVYSKPHTFSFDGYFTLLKSKKNKNIRPLM